MRKILCFIALLPFVSFAQTVLTNKDVVDLVKSGLSPEIVIAKIRASETAFDTSAEALKSLTTSGVPDSVVVAVIEKSQKAEAANEIPEQGTLADIVNLKKVYIFSDNLKSRDMIAKILKTAGFQIVERIEMSDFVVRYDERTEDVGALTTRRDLKKYGTLKVVMSAADGKRLRLIYSVEKSEYWVWEKNPAKATTEQFLTDLKQIQRSTK